MTFGDRYALLTALDKVIIGINLAAVLLNFGDWLWMFTSFTIAILFFYAITGLNKDTARGRKILSYRQYQKVMTKSQS